MGAVFANNATATLAAGINSAATTLVVTAGQGALFPTPTGGDYFYATLVNASNDIEIVKVTDRTSDTFTIVRAQEGTSATAWLTNDKIELRITAAGLMELATNIDTADLADNSVSTAKVQDGAITAAKILNATITAAKLAAGAVVSALGFTPVKQGGSDTVQLTNSSSDLSVSVNGSTVGKLLTERSNAAVRSAGYRGVPLTGVSSHVTFSLTDAGTGYFHNSAAPHTFWVPTFASVAFEQGSVIVVHNYYGSTTCVVGPSAGVTLVWADSGLTGPRNLAPGGLCSVMRVVDDVWVISGSGLS